MKVLTSIFIVVLTTSLYAKQRVGDVSIKSAVTFNTLCSKCHEGQCSGRLTFDKGSQVASNHIKRYAEDENISKDEVKEFFTLLNFMKKECLLIMPDKITHNQENLLSFATTSHKQYFIPLGILKKGDYSLFIKIKDDTPFRLELISSQFDSYLDRNICSCLKKREFDFSVDEEIKYFIRLKSRKAIYLDDLEIKKINSM